MTIKHRKASKKRWAGVSLKERKRAMKLLVKIRWAKTSKKRRKEIAYELVAARKNKK